MFLLLFFLSISDSLRLVGGNMDHRYSSGLASGSSSSSSGGAFFNSAELARPNRGDRHKHDGDGK